MPWAWTSPPLSTGRRTARGCRGTRLMHQSRALQVVRICIRLPSLLIWSWKHSCKRLNAGKVGVSIFVWTNPNAAPPCRSWNCSTPFRLETWTSRFSPPLACPRTAEADTNRTLPSSPKPHSLCATSNAWPRFRIRPRVPQRNRKWPGHPWQARRWEKRSPASKYTKNGKKPIW